MDNQPEKSIALATFKKPNTHLVRRSVNNFYVFGAARTCTSTPATGPNWLTIDSNLTKFPWFTIISDVPFEAWVYTLNPDYSWNNLIRASNPAFSCGPSPVSLEPLSIRLNRLKNRSIEPVINHLSAMGTVTCRQVDFPVRNPHRFRPFHGPDSSSVHYPGAQDTRTSLFHNRFQSVPP